MCCWWCFNISAGRPVQDPRPGSAALWLLFDDSQTFERPIQAVFDDDVLVWKPSVGDPPVQMLDCRQIRSSSSSSSHSSSLPLTGRPESTSRQARKRRWSDTRPEAFPPEDAGIHGEQEVHSDHSLTITERQTGIYTWTGRKALFDFRWSDLRLK